MTSRKPLGQHTAGRDAARAGAQADASCPQLRRVLGGREESPEFGSSRSPLFPKAKCGKTNPPAGQHLYFKITHPFNKDETPRVTFHTQGPSGRWLRLEPAPAPAPPAPACRHRAPLLSQADGFQFAAVFVFDPLDSL